ncbi:MAG: TonB-dependent receptor [Pseudomonadota bacterium]
MRQRLFIASAAAAAVASCYSSALGQDALDEPDTIIVTGTRLPTPLDQVGRSVSVLTAADIDVRQQRFVFDALAAIPGVQVVRTGSFGSLATVSVRGLDSDQTLVVQDGVVINNPASFGNGFNFANFDTADVERIEVIRGAQSTLYGSDAIGGVINIVTKDGRDGFGADALFELGSFDTIRGSASVYGGDDVASGRISFSGVTTNGFSSADEADGNVEDDSFDNVTLSAKGRYSPIDALRFDVVARYQDSENEFDSFAGGRPVDGDEVGQTEELSIAGFATHTALDGALENRFAITYLRNDQLNVTDGAPSFDALGTRISYEYQGTVDLVRWATLVAGAEYDVQESEVVVGFGGNQKIKTTSGFGLVQLTPTEAITLNAGVRHDASDEFGSETTFSVSGAATLPQTGTIFRASFSEGFRAPTAGELGFNPDLFAEFSNGWDVGLEQPIAGGRARLTATYFDQQIDDLIAFDLDAFTFVNVQEFESRGVEVALDADLGDRLTVRSAYTYVDATNVTTATVAFNQPDHRFNVELAARATDRLTLSVGVNYNGTERDGVNTLDAFTLVSVRGRYLVNDAIELFARVENATDADFQDNFGYGTAPASAFGGVRARF